VTKGVDEPYRLFTSRAEFRLILRQDNAPERLVPVARELGILGPRGTDAWRERVARRRFWQGWLEEARMDPPVANPVLARMKSALLGERTPVLEVARRPEVGVAGLLAASGREAPSPLDQEALGTVLVDVRYAGYIRREEDRASRLQRLGELRIPDTFSFAGSPTLSMEAREQLQRARPETLAQAAGVRGVTPADVQALAVAVRKAKTQKCPGPVED
jgi:tRNA uridine 5-carboxymethylaminomethyl modification enzyme